MTKVDITSKALKQYKTLSHKDQSKILKKLTVLELSPLSGKKLTGELREFRSLRAWPYRIIYYLDARKKSISVVTIAHRQGVYK